MAKVARAAAKLFSTKTYLETSMEEIAAKAGVSKGGMYYYFAKKSDVLYYIVDKVLDDLLTGLEEELAEFDSGGDRLKHVVRRHLSYYTDHLPEVQTLLNDRRCLDRDQFQVIEAKQQRYFEIVRRIVAECLDRPPTAELNPLAFAYFGLCNWIPGWFRPSGRVSIDELIDTTYRLFTDGINSFAERK